MRISKVNMQTLSSEESEFLQQLLEKEQSAILRIIKNSLGASYYDLKDDCLSNVFLLAVHKIKIVMKCKYPDRWLARSTRLAVMNAIRSRNNRFSQTASIDVDSVALSEDVSELAIYNIWMEQDAYNALKRELTKRELQVMELMCEQDKTTQEIAKELKITQTTVRNIKKSIKDKYRYAIQNKLY